MPEPPKLYGPPSRGISSSDVHRAADELLREGERPTIERVRAKLGTGSPNTINPHLDAWWKTLSARLDAGPAALHRLPASQAQHSTARSLAIDKQHIEVRSHVLSLREGELESRLKDREHQHAGLESQLQALTTLLRKGQATREFQSRRILELEEQLLARTPAPKRTAGLRTPRTRRKKKSPRRADQLRKSRASKATAKPKRATTRRSRR